MKVVELFNSIDGEGKRAGMLATFIRLSTCNLRCSYCDSAYAFDDKLAEEMSIQSIVENCDKYDCPQITLTGGEPLVSKDVDLLLSELDSHGYDVNVETNGSIDPSAYHKYKNVWFTVDWKCPSSGMESKMNPKAFETLREQDVLKFVVGSNEDLQSALHVIKKYNPKCSIYFSPVFGYDAKNIVEFMKDHKLNDCKVQLQIHKYIYDPNARGV